MSKTLATDLLDEYRRDWHAALAPCPHCLLERCPEGEREALNLLLDEFLETADMPPYSPVQMRRLRERTAAMMERVLNDPGVVARRDQAEAAWRDLPWRVQRWRRARFGLLCARLRLHLFVGRFRPKPWD